MVEFRLDKPGELDFDPILDLLDIMWNLGSCAELENDPTGCGHIFHSIDS